MRNNCLRRVGFARPGGESRSEVDRRNLPEVGAARGAVPDPERQPLCEEFRQGGFPDRIRGLCDIVGHADDRGRILIRFQVRERGAGIAVAGLAHAPAIDEMAGALCVTAVRVAGRDDGLYVCEAETGRSFSHFGFFGVSCVRVHSIAISPSVLNSRLKSVPSATSS